MLRMVVVWSLKFLGALGGAGACVWLAILCLGRAMGAGGGADQLSSWSHVVVEILAGTPLGWLAAGFYLIFGYGFLVILMILVILKAIRAALEHSFSWLLIAGVTAVVLLAVDKGDETKSAASVVLYVTCGLICLVGVAFFLAVLVSLFHADAARREEGRRTLSIIWRRETSDEGNADPAGSAAGQSGVTGQTPPAASSGAD